MLTRPLPLLCLGAVERYRLTGAAASAAPCRRYVMRGEQPKPDPLGAAEALGVEAEAFWAFAALMERLERNFSSDGAGMHAQLGALRRLLG